MKMIMIKTLMISSTTILALKNPMSMGIMLIFQTSMMSMIMGKTMTTSWFMMITFLMMIGGLMILFMYMSSIASNEKFLMNVNLSMLIMIMMIITEDLLSDFQVNEKQGLIIMSEIDKTSMIKLYNEKSMMITMIMVLFLLLTMVSTTKIVKHHKGPLRQKTYE